MNKEKQEPGPGWWFCRTPRTPALYDENGEVFLHGKPCETNYCPDCVRHNAYKVTTALHYVEPQALITINDVGLNHREARSRMRDLRRHLREKTRIRLEQVYVLERYTEHGHDGLHAHIYAHGDFPDKHDVFRAATAVGMDVSRSDRPVRVDAMVNHANLTYVFKATESERTLKTFLDDNGGSLMSPTKGFWRVPARHLPQAATGGCSARSGASHDHHPWLPPCQPETWRGRRAGGRAGSAAAGLT